MSAEDDMPWVPPRGLTLKLLRDVLGDEPRPFLTDVVDLLAFGEPLPAKVLDLLPLLTEQKGRDGRADTLRVLASKGFPYERIVSERRRATTALLDGVRRAGQSVLIGSFDRHADEPIPPHYFDVPRNLGSEDNSITTDEYAVSASPRWQKQFEAEWQRKPTPWLNVRIDHNWLVAWLAPQLVRSTGVDGITQIMSAEGHVILQGTPTLAGDLRPWIGMKDETLVAVSGTPESEDQSPALVRRRGKKPTVFEGVKMAMQADLTGGALTAEDLSGMLEKALEDRYGASRDTCRRARNAVLAARAGSSKYVSAQKVPAKVNSRQRTTIDK